MAVFFAELSIVMLIALIISFVMYKLKQPLLIGHILTGVLAGPLFLNILSSSQGYETFSHMGVALLLFIVGLHLNLKLIKEIGFVSLIAGSVQVIVTALFAFFISGFFKISLFSSVLISFGLAFSSTIVIIKLLTDKKEIDKVYGKLSTGILIVQDLVAVIVLMILASLTSFHQGNVVYEVSITFLKGILALVFVFVFSKYVLEIVLDTIAKSQELLFIFIISWCLGVATFFVMLGFSVEIGALLAGVALASSPYQYEISSKIKPLRDFFIIMFFILLGSEMIPFSGVVPTDKLAYILGSFSHVFVPALVFSFFVLIGKPLIVFLLLNLLGFHSRVSFETSVSLAQVSEFSLIIILLAASNGLVSEKIVSMLTLIAIITITISTFMITHSSRLYLALRKIIPIFEIRKPKKNFERNIEKNHEILVFGYDRIGYSLLKTIDKLGKKYIVVDYNPIIIKKLEAQKISCVYGDASDIEMLSEFNFDGVKLLISTIPDIETNMLLIMEFKKRNMEATIILTANQIDNALELYKEGADYVILPHFLGGDYVSTLIENYDGNFQRFLKEKIKHINELKERKNFGLEHPKYDR